MTKEIELIILSTPDGVYLSYMPKEDEFYTIDGFLNRRFDSINITIQTFIEDTLQLSEILGEIDQID